MTRLEVRVDGVVQGVGFRPHAFRLAAEHRVSGFVGNDARGVVLEVEGAAGDLDAFLADLVSRPPPLARIGVITTRPLPPRGETTFAIAASSGGRAGALVPADAATCDACLAELHDPTDRRFRHPFLSCTDCGPRFTIIDGAPYDRPRTTMAGFPMCAACRAEYEDPADRRFHAQPIACHGCGPVLRLHGSSASDPLEEALALLLSGAIVAVKGLGGFHLACRADDEAAVARLRERKRREAKPFAVLVADLAAAHALAELDRAAAALLVSPARPIVLAPRRPGATVAPSVAPGAVELGLLLPYTPVHHLLAGDAGRPLVLTSGNRCDEPIAFEDDDAIARLTAIADAVLLHDRPIRTRAEDSVVRAVRGRPLVLRRARGMVPAVLALPVPAERDVLAVGAELKATACLARGARAWVGPHVGDLRDAPTLASFAAGIEHLERLLSVRPAVVAHDLHPDMLSTTLALAREGVEHVAVQHHHAHLAAVLAEHGEARPAVGAILDGAGLGPDGTVWGGELLLGDLAGAARVGHLLAVRQPGGDRAAREPWRMACAWLVACGEAEPAVPPALRRAVAPAAWRAVARMCVTGIGAPWTTSAGRLCDAVAALCGLHPRTSYEGQAAMALEALADPAERGAYALPVERPASTAAGRAAPRTAVAPRACAPLLLDARPLVRAVVADLAAHTAPAVVAARFHRGLATATATALAGAAADAGLDRVVLGGGVWANRLLLTLTAGDLEARGLRVLVPEVLPPGDGGLSFGQAAIAAARTTTGGRTDVRA